MTHSDNKEMSFWDHLDELRSTLIHSVLAVCALSIVAFLFKGAIFDIVLAPASSDFFVYRLLGWNLEINLINIEIAAQFFVHLKVALVLGLVLAVPYIMWELWKFVSPALYDNEARAVKTAFVFSSLFFYVGAAVGYCFVLPVCLNFFTEYTVSETITNTINLNSYISIFLSMVLLIGLVFEFPLIVLALNRMGIVGKSGLRKGRKYALVVILVVSAIITPSDPFSMIVLAIPMYLLYELSVLFSKDVERQ